MDVAGLRIEERGAGVVLWLKVSAGASRTAVVGVFGDALKVSVAAPREAGKANEAVLELVARTLGVTRSAVAILHGHAQPWKTVGISGISGPAVRERLAALGGSPSR